MQMYIRRSQQPQGPFRGRVGVDLPMDNKTMDKLSLEEGVNNEASFELLEINSKKN